MKKITYSLIIAGAMATGSVHAQKSLKVAHINSGEVLGLMPERKKAAEDGEKFAKELEKQLQMMMAEYQKKVEAYQKDEPSLSGALKETRIEEIKSLETRIQTFQKKAQEDLANKEQELLKPIVDKAKKAIEQVATENNYDYVLDTSTGAFLYWKSTDDILPMVKKKLGIQ